MENEPQASVQNKSYIASRLEAARQKVQREKDGLDTIVGDMCNVIAQEVHARRRYDAAQRNSVIVPASEAESNLRYYKIYEIYYQSNTMSRALDFSVAITDPGSSDDPYKDMMNDVCDFVWHYTNGNTTELTDIADAAYYAVDRDQGPTDFPTYMEAYPGSGGRRARDNTPFASYPSFFGEYLPGSTSGGSHGELRPGVAKIYSDKHCTVACSMLAPRHEARLDHEKEISEKIEVCNAICGVLCRGAIVTTTYNGAIETLMIKQVVGVQGGGWREAIGLESYKHTPESKWGGTGAHHVTEVHLPDYARGCEAEGVRWYAIAERCMRLQYEHATKELYLDSKDHADGRDFKMHVVRPSASLLYAVLEGTWTGDQGMTTTISTCYTLGTFIARHKYLEGWARTRPTGNARRASQNTEREPIKGPMYKVLAKVNRVHKRSVAFKAQNTEHPVPARESPPDQPATAPAQSEEQSTSPGGVPAEPEDHAEPSGDAVASSPEKSDAQTSQATDGTPDDPTDGVVKDGEKSWADVVKNKQAFGIGPEKTLLAVEAAMMRASMGSKAAPRGLSLHASSAAMCAESMGMVA